MPTYKVTVLMGHFGKKKAKDGTKYIWAKDTVDAMFKARLMPGVKKVLEVTRFVSSTPILVQIPYVGFHKLRRRKKRVA